jgi:hypothetical protein
MNYYEDPSSWVLRVREVVEVKVSDLPPVPPVPLHNGRLPPQPKTPRVYKEVRVCSTEGCGRALNLGRWKTQGDTCGTCKREAKRKAREHVEELKTQHVSSQDEIERQLNDDTPLPDDDDEAGWAKLLGAEAS